jgi:hypothetical protein
MTPELTALVLAALLQCAQMVLYSISGNAQAGTKAAMSSEGPEGRTDRPRGPRPAGHEQPF